MWHLKEINALIVRKNKSTVISKKKKSFRLIIVTSIGQNTGQVCLIISRLPVSFRIVYLIIFYRSPPSSCLLLLVQRSFCLASCNDDDATGTVPRRDTRDRRRRSPIDRNRHLRLGPSLHVRTCARTYRPRIPYLRATYVHDARTIYAYSPLHTIREQGRKRNERMKSVRIANSV